jgi:hypothetical protein
MLKVRQQDAEHLALPQEDVHPQARFPVLLQVAAARRAAAQKQQVQLRDVQEQLKLEPPVQASQPRAPCRSDEPEPWDELSSYRQVRQVARHRESSQGQLRERARRHPASWQPSPEHQAPRQ